MIHDPRARVPETAVDALARRTARLSEMIERATHSAPDKAIRDAGKELVDLLGERVEEIRELHAMEDDDLPERLRIFRIRLKLAEAKVLSWPSSKARKSPPARRRGEESATRTRARRGSKPIQTAA